MSVVMEVPRPAPEQSRRQRVADQVAGLRSRLTLLSFGRLITAAGAVLVIAAFALWLLRAPTPSVESGLPRAASATTVANGRVSPASATGSSGLAPSAGAPAASGMVVVQAAGGVAKPGVYRLPTGSRVTDLVAAAGGVTPGIDESLLPLASKLVDGQRVYVPRPGEPAPVAIAAAASGGSGAATPGAPIDLNSATAAQLDTLPGVGPATAAAIVSFREKHGPFRAVTGLLDVPGIGDTKLNALKDLVTV
jgi:competence protein ComEA